VVACSTMNAGDVRDDTGICCCCAGTKCSLQQHPSHVARQMQQGRGWEAGGAVLSGLMVYLKGVALPTDVSC